MNVCGHDNQQDTRLDLTLIVVGVAFGRQRASGRNKNSSSIPEYHTFHCQRESPVEDDASDSGQAHNRENGHI